ncbi:MAG: hypothetical protein AAGG55_04800 [Pseudomonadota bacterium]
MLKFLAIAGVLFLLAACGDSPPVTLGAGEFVPEIPQQAPIHSESIHYREVTLHPRATYSITAKVLSKRRYRFGQLSAAANWDFALGWGPMSNEARIEGLRVIQGDRLMFLHLQHARLSLDVAQTSSANVHLVTKNPEQEKQLNAIPVGAIVKLTGLLVDVELSSGDTIPTSLTRRDIGLGACEILYVHEVSFATDTRSIGML